MRSKAMLSLCGIVALCAIAVDARADAPSVADAARKAQEAKAPAEAPPPEAAASLGCDAGGDLRTGPATIAKHWSKNDYPTSIPEGESYYLVARGDTLWDIAKRFLGNPFLWPQIWDRNKYVTDAHWIYPCDPLIIPKVAVVSDRAGEGGEGTGDEGGKEVAIEPSTPLEPAIQEMALQCAPYIVDAPEDDSLYIIGSEQGAVKLAFADRDILYLSKGSNGGIKAGDVYSIHHPTYTVKHPDTQKNIGRKVETTGWLRVLLVTENTATAVVEQACDAIHAGDYLTPFERVVVPLIIRKPAVDRLTPPSGKITGAVIDYKDDAYMGGQNYLMTINLGRANGIAPGNILTVFKVMYPQIPTTRVVLGEVAIVSVRDRTATAIVTYSADHIMLGDRVELQ